MHLLKDSIGVYGIAGDENAETNTNILTRADRVEPTGGRIAYQMILPNHPAFRRTNEQKLYREMHLRLLRQAGFAASDFEDLSHLTTEQRDLLRKAYFGLGKAAARRVNRILAQGLAAADPQVLRVVRRYPIRFRAQLYTACCQLGNRVTQFCETFPVLALLFFTRQFRSEDLEETKRIREEGKRMILRGERLRRIAGLVGFSMVFRRVKPGAAEQAVVTEASDELVARCLPQSLSGQRRWFAAVSRASQFGTSFMEWTARRVGEMAGSQREALAELNDISDWVKASQLAGLPESDSQAAAGDMGCQFVTRRFQREMSLRTVRRLSREWHAAVAGGMSESARVRFPRPRLHGGHVREFRIVPITDSSALYLEGKSLHHCVTTYQQEILRGKCWIYSVHKGSRHVATVAVNLTDDEIRLGQIRASCNSKPDVSCEQAIQEWFRSRHEAVGRKVRLMTGDS